MKYGQFIYRSRLTLDFHRVIHRNELLFDEQKKKNNIKKIISPTILF